MKKKVLGILLTLVLVVSLGLVTAVPVGAATTADYNAAVIKAADWLEVNQNDDGGFGWVLGSQPSHNVIGITAMGILKAYELDAKPKYRTALAEAYNFAVLKPPTYAWDTIKGYFEKDPKGVDSFPDITFLVWLANAAADDESLLTEINVLQEPDIMATDIAALAKLRWDNRILYIGSSAETPLNGTATSYAEWLRDFRSGTPALIPWDLGAGVKAALTLDFYYPEQGYAGQAVEIANVIYDSLYVVSPPDFNILEPVESMFINGISGALEAFVEVNLYPDKVTDLTDILLHYQHADGYWNYHDVEGAQMSVQDTAYAVMALLRQGDANSLVAAQKGANWLVSSQLDMGGWFWVEGSTTEYAEIDSEAAWAIKVLLDISDSLRMIAAYIPKIGISVTPLAVDFGSVTPGIDSDTKTVTVKNTGNVKENFSATLTNISDPDVYTGGLKIGADLVSAWGGETGVEVSVEKVESLVLRVPAEIAPGTYTAVLVFWAELTPIE